MRINGLNSRCFICGQFIDLFLSLETDRERFCSNCEPALYNEYAARRNPLNPFVAPGQYQQVMMNQLQQQKMRALEAISQSQLNTGVIGGIFNGSR